MCPSHDQVVSFRAVTNLPHDADNMELPGERLQRAEGGGAHSEQQDPLHTRLRLCSDGAVRDTELWSREQHLFMPKGMVRAAGRARGPVP